MVLGVLVWSVVHSFAISGGSARKRLIARIGEPAYKGGFALTILASIVLMVFGWRANAPVAIYWPPAWGLPAAELLVFVALILFVASGLPTNLKRVVRHPQLSGVVVWSGAHLLANGDRRSLVLFGGLGLWAVLAVVLTNHRDGAWEKPEPVSMKSELKPLLITIGAYAVLFVAHPYFTGISLPTPW